MPKDLKGIHKYAETDNPPKFSELMNLGMDSVSDAIVYLEGTSAERLALDPAPAGAIWKDSDVAGRLWSTSPAGKWRLHEGRISDIARPWTAIASPVWGRTITFSVPTVLAANEELAIWAGQHAGAWVTVTNGGITRNPTDTTLTVHAARLLNGGETAINVLWRVVAVG